MKGAAARIVVAEHWSVLRRGLSSLLHGDHVVVEELDDVERLPAVVQDRSADLAIVGEAPGWDLVSVVAKLTETNGGVSVVVLCDQLAPTELRELLRAGSRGVLSKRTLGDGLGDDLARVLRGERVIDQRFLPLLFDQAGEGDDRAGGPADTGPLTPREHDVLTQLARGASNRQIAEALLVGEATVKSHLSAIYAKLGVDNRHRAIGRAVELGLLA